MRLGHFILSLIIELSYWLCSITLYHPQLRLLGLLLLLLFLFSSILINIIIIILHVAPLIIQKVFPKWVELLLVHGLQARRSVHYRDLGQFLTSWLLSRSCVGLLHGHWLLQRLAHQAVVIINLFGVTRLHSTQAIPELEALSRHLLCKQWSRANWPLRRIVEKHLLAIANLICINFNLLRMLLAYHVVWLLLLSRDIAIWLHSLISDSSGAVHYRVVLAPA